MAAPPNAFLESLQKAAVFHEDSISFALRLESDFDPEVDSHEFCYIPPLRSPPPTGTDEDARYRTRRHALRTRVVLVIYALAAMKKALRKSTNLPAVT